METIGPETSGFLPSYLADEALFEDRAEAGRQLGRALPADLREPVVVGTTAGGVEIAAEAAAALHAPLDAVAVAAITLASEHVVGAVAPGGAPYLREPEAPSRVQAIVATARARERAQHSEALLHERSRPLALAGRDLVLVDEAITTGATMAAAVAWGRDAGARRVVAAVPVGASAGLAVVRELADDVVCLHEFEVIGARAVWFGELPRLSDEDVRRLLESPR